jgi:hypothetical protein
MCWPTWFEKFQKQQFHTYCEWWWQNCCSLLMNCAGITGIIALNNNCDRINKWAVWTFEPGHTTYEQYMLIDLTQPSDEARIQLILLTTKLISFPSKVSLMYSHKKRVLGYVKHFFPHVLTLLKSQTLIVRDIFFLSIEGVDLNLGLYCLPHNNEWLFYEHRLFLF